LQAHEWQSLQKEANLTTNGSGSYAMSTIASDYSRPVSTTEYDRSNYKKITIVSPQKWQELKAYMTIPTGIQRYGRVRGNNLLLIPDNANDELYFEYISKNYVVDSLGNEKAEFTADSDTTIFSEMLLELGLKYYLKNEDGLPAEADADRYYTLMKELMTSEKPMPTLRGMDSLGKRRSKFILTIPDYA
jgi:hypothetical protein